MFDDRWFGVYVAAALAALFLLVVIGFWFPGGLEQFNALSGIWIEPTGAYLYPLIWNAVEAVFPHNTTLWIVFSFQCLLFGGIVLAVSSLARQFNEKLFIPAAVLTIFCPNLIGRVAMSFNEILYLFFCSFGLLWLFLYYKNPGSYRYAIFSGVALGLAFLTRGTILFFPIL